MKDGDVKVHNSLIVSDFMGSDHAPVVLELEIA